MINVSLLAFMLPFLLGTGGRLLGKDTLDDLSPRVWEGRQELLEQDAATQAVFFEPTSQRREA